MNNSTRIHFFLLSMLLVTCLFYSCESCSNPLNKNSNISYDIIIEDGAEIDSIDYYSEFEIINEVFDNIDMPFHFSINEIIHVPRNREGGSSEAYVNNLARKYSTSENAICITNQYLSGDNIIILARYQHVNNKTKTQFFSSVQYFKDPYLFLHEFLHRVNFQHEQYPVDSTMNILAMCNTFFNYNITVPQKDALLKDTKHKIQLNEPVFTIFNNNNPIDLNRLYPGCIDFNSLDLNVDSILINSTTNMCNPCENADRYLPINIAAVESQFKSRQSPEDDSEGEQTNSNSINTMELVNTNYLDSLIEKEYNYILNNSTLITLEEFKEIRYESMNLIRKTNILEYYIKKHGVNTNVTTNDFLDILNNEELEKDFLSKIHDYYKGLQADNDSKVNDIKSKIEKENNKYTVKNDSILLLEELIDKAEDKEEREKLRKRKKDLSLELKPIEFYIADLNQELLEVQNITEINQIIKNME